MKNNNAKLTAGSVSLTLAGMSIGMFFGHLAMTVFNLTDTYFVAKLGTTNLAAMSFTFPIVAILLGVVFGIGIGASSVISYAIGKGRYKQVKILSTDALFLTFFLCSIFSLLGIVFMDEIFSVLGAGGATLMYVKKYMLIWFAVFPFSAIPMVGNNIIRATGNAKIPGMIMSFSAIINLIVDPILIFGMFGFPAMGISGAAISTVLARTIAMCITLYYLNIKLKFIDLSGLGISRFYRSWKKILHIGLPSALTQIFIPISAAIVTRIIAEFGDNAIAAAGAGMKIDMFALITVFALASAVLPFAGQNYGALKLNRIDRSYTISNIFSVGWGILCFLIMYIFAHPIAEIFTNDSSVALY
ncbi:MAG: MATE family efflux transporter, partial [Candidatus Omnitrophota bacterium]